MRKPEEKNVYLQNEAVSYRGKKVKTREFIISLLSVYYVQIVEQVVIYHWKLSARVYIGMSSHAFVGELKIWSKIFFFVQK